MIKKIATDISLILLSLILLTGCGSKVTGQNEEEPAKKEGIEIGLSMTPL